MKEANKKIDTSEIIEIVENATIIYTEGKRAIFEAIFVTEEGEIIFGQIVKVEKTDYCRSAGSIDCHEIFIEWGGIPKDNINHIEGGIKKKVFRK